MIRSLTALVLPLLLAFLVSGCCSCGDGASDPGPKRPGDVVRDLRDAVSQQHWVEAKACFTDELQSQQAAAMLSGEFFRRKAHRDTLADGKACACLGGPERDPEEVEVEYPLGAGDVVLAVSAESGRAEATISPLHATHVGHPGEGDPRPQTIVLTKGPQGWKVSELRRAQASSAPGCSPCK